MGFREILRVDSPVSNISYVPHVRPPRLPWRKCRDIFEGQHMTRHKKKGPQCDPCLNFYSCALSLWYARNSVYSLCYVVVPSKCVAYYRSCNDIVTQTVIEMIYC